MGFHSQFVLSLMIYCHFLSIKFLYFFSDEREDVQKKTFTKWINSQLSKVRTQQQNQFMHQSFIPAIPWPLWGHGIAGILTFLYAKPGYMPSTAGILFWSKLFQKPCSNVKLPRLVGAWNQKLCDSMALWDWCWGQNMTLKPTKSLLSLAPWMLGLQMTGALSSNSEALIWAASWQNQQNNVHPAKSQIRLGMCPVLSEFAMRSMGS